MFSVCHKLITACLTLAFLSGCRKESFNASGLKAASGKAATTTPVDVTGFIADAATTSTISLSWVKADGADGYDISYVPGATAPASCSAGTLVALNDGDLQTSQISGLTANTTYSFRICADFGDSSDGEILTAETAPADPATFDAASSGQTSVNLTWAAVSGIDSYAISYATGATAPADCSTGTQLTALSSAT
jgi:hypothetical protein